MQATPLVAPKLWAQCTTHALLGNSEAMRSANAFVLKVARSEINVLLTGETGTGKECVAQSIHRQSARSNGPFMPVNCAALPDALLESELFGFERGAFTGAQAAYEGKFRAARGGTLFLDEIGEMSLYAQAKILRALESREVYPLGSKRAIALDVRVVAATNQDLGELVAANRFRKDLYYRLNVARIHLPPLRERKADIPMLLRHFLSEMNSRHAQGVSEFTAAALSCVMNHDWPGNVRELRNLLEVVFVDPPEHTVDLCHLPDSLRTTTGPAAADVTRLERSRILSALIAAQWNKTLAARDLRCSRMTLYRKMSRYCIAEPSPLHVRQRVTPAVTPHKAPDAGPPCCPGVTSHR
ncbi:sigma-54 interaction domain protein [Caballeronia arvi]|uniref:Sigma-54 interaction domain protein n=1 Tax=Caballeronia arvi TaxID=1777135 RepID=A0A158KLI0_9BURK|nr:sigma-54 interaction domain protein [Caballeronia arvi]